MIAYFHSAVNGCSWFSSILLTFYELLYHFFGGFEEIFIKSFDGFGEYWGDKQ